MSDADPKNPRRKPGRPPSKRPTRVLSVRVPRRIYEEMSIFRDYQRHSMSEVLEMSWAAFRVQLSLDGGGGWPPPIKEDNDEYEETVARRARLTSADGPIKGQVKILANLEET